MQKKTFILLFYILSFSFCFLYSGCKKEPGRDGNSSIIGKVEVKQYNAATGYFDKQFAGADEEVYIIYGDEVSYGERIRTDYEGDFEFKYLRKGKYKIYVYSIDSVAFLGPPVNPNAPRIALVKELEITAKKQTVDAGIFTVLKK